MRSLNNLHNYRGLRLEISRKSIFRAYLLILVLIISTCVIACTTLYSPVKHIPVRLNEVGPIGTDNKEISLVNGLTKSKIIKWYAHFDADLKQWTDFVMDGLEDELKKRGVQVKPDSKNIFKVSVESVKGISGLVLGLRCTVTARIDKSDGTWSSRVYEGSTYSHTSTQDAIDRSIYLLIVSILDDYDFKEAISRGTVDEQERIVERLEKLRKMKEKGAITEEGYQNKRKEILKSL